MAEKLSNNHYLQTLKYLVISMRPKQWLKNCFVFTPLIFGLKLFDLSALTKTFFTVILFSGCAAAMYLINDIFDLKRDKLHPVKKKRPITAGYLDINTALTFAVIISLISLTLSYLLNYFVFLTLATYIVTNLIYSKILKEMIIVDAMCVAFFFILRILAGAASAQLTPSPWIIICTGLLALFIAFGKRHHELKLLEKSAKQHRSVLDRYDARFIDQMMTITAASLVVYYTLYTINSPVNLLANQNLVFTVPFVYYGIFRYLYNIHHYHKGGDPTETLLTDEKLQLDIILWLFVVFAALYF